MTAEVEAGETASVERRPLPAFIKLLTGIAATVLITYGANMYERQHILSQLGFRASRTFLANGVTDGAAAWRSDAGWTHRIARLSGTADPATRARIAEQLAAKKGIAGVEWMDR